MANIAMELVWEVKSRLFKEIENYKRVMGCAEAERKAQDPATDKSKGTAKSLVEFLQVDDVDSGKYDDPRDLPENSCTRPCVRGEPRTCYYRFHFEPYATMGKACLDCLTNVTECYSSGCVTADGYEKAILTINRRLPGPSIQVCEGDMIVVDVKNLMPGRSTTIHWHGFKQKNYKFMDGVPMVTQCPITESITFRYTFKAEDPGLFFYHSHAGLQKVDGLVGSLMVRQPIDEDPSKEQYHWDLPSHVVVVQDWYHMTADSMFPGLQYHDNEQQASSYLIQGRGQYIKADGTLLANTPLAEFKVTRGFRYVFRLVAGTCFECQYVFTIEGHDMTIIGVDAGSTKPYRVDSLTMSPGERYSVVVHSNRPVDTYWMQVRSVGVCDHRRAYQVALLRYQGSPVRPTSPTPTFDINSVNNPGLTMSPVNCHCTEETRDREGPCLPDLKSTKVTPVEIRRPQPDVRIVWGFGFYYFENNELFYSKKYKKWLQSPFYKVGSTVNGVVNLFPSSPILSQPGDVPRDILCPPDDFSVEGFTSWNKVDKECVHVMKVPANAVVEIVSIDVDNDEWDAEGISHSIHLHGYEMYILEMGLMPQVKPLNQSYAQLMKDLQCDRTSIPDDLVTKDTFPLSAMGYVVIRILTDNPGFWLFHCHFAYHLESGMSGILQVGETPTFPTPPERFPMCGDYVP